MKNQKTMKKSITEQLNEVLRGTSSLNEASYPPVNVKFDFNKLIPMSRAEDELAKDLSDEEIKGVIDAFIEQLSTEEGIVAYMSDGEFFNY